MPGVASSWFLAPTVQFGVHFSDAALRSADWPEEVFGTAYDVSSSFAVITSYEPVPVERQRSASRLGVSVLVNPLKRLQRMEYLDKKVGFSEAILSEIAQLDEEKPFLKRERADGNG